MPTLSYHDIVVPNFEALVAQPFDLKSPYRSTVPLLAYWSNPRNRLSELSQTIGLHISQDAKSTFEYTVSPRQGRGKASHTDLMITAPSLAIAEEVKYREPDYELVSDWLGDSATPNKTLVLGSWLKIINDATGSNLTIQQVNNITYQLIHRTASVCTIPATDRAVIYHCFDLRDGHRYEEQLRHLADLIGVPEQLKFFLLSTTIAPSALYLRLQRDWDTRVSRDLSNPIRKLLVEQQLATFGQSAVTTFQ